jgi:Flp pilus assembly protein TadD
LRSHGRIRRLAHSRQSTTFSYTSKAEQALLKAIELEPNLLGSYLALGRLYAKTNRYEKALAQLGQALQLNPEDVGAYMLLGMIYEQQEDIRKAQAAYEEVLELNPGFGPAANNLAYLYSKPGGDQEKALALAQRARGELPKDPHVSDTLGWILYTRGVCEQTLNLLTESAAKLPTNPEVHYHLGITYYKLGKR